MACYFTPLSRLSSPMPFMLPFNLMEYAIKPLSLALRPVS